MDIPQQSEYNKYMNKRLPELKLLHPELKHKELFRLVSDEWQSKHK